MMDQLRCVCIVSLGFALALPARVQAEQAVDPAVLIENLRADDFDERNAALAQLAALGDSARGALEQASRSKDPEIAAAVRGLLAKLQKCELVIIAVDRDGLTLPELGLNLGLYSVGMRGQEMRSETTDAKGIVSFAGLSPGQHYLQFGWKGIPPLPAHRQTILELRTGRNMLLQVLTAGGVISSALCDAEGKALKDGQLSVFPDIRFDPELFECQLQLAEQWQQPSQSGSCDEKGEVKIEALPEGVYDCIARCSGYAPALLRGVRVRQGEQTKLPAFTLKARAKGKLQFVLQHSDGKPVASAKVSLSLDPVVNFSDPERLQAYRRMKQTLDRSRGLGGAGNAVESDAGGKITVEDLDPGKYQLSLRLEKQTPQRLGAVEVSSTPGDAPVYKLAQGGALKGLIVSADNANNRYASITVLPHQDLDEQILRGWGSQSPFSASAQAQQDGLYQVKNLAPGKYAVIVQAYQANQCFLIYGVEVAEGKTATVPDVNLGPIVPRAPYPTLRGRASLVDGTPAGGARVVAYVAGHGAVGSSQSAENGSFNCSYNKLGTTTEPTHLVVRAAGCKPCLVDLTKKEVDRNALNVKLEKQSYGALRLKITDEAGQPLSGVAVSALNQNQNQNRNANAAVPPAKTDANGLVQLRDLASGVRKLQLVKEGYFTLEEPRFNLQPVETNEATLQMRRGFAVSGTVAAPADVPVAPSLVCLSGAQRSCEVSPDGAFRFEGLPPGKHELTLNSALLVLEQKVSVEVVASDVSVVLKPALRAGLTLQAPAECVSWSATLIATHNWKATDGREPERAATGKVDRDGRIEFSGMVPGSYYLLLSKPDQMLSYRYGSANFTCNAGQLLGPFETQALRRVADLSKLSVQATLKPVPHQAVVRGRVAFGESIGNPAVTLRLMGASALGTLTFYPQQDRGRLGTLTTIGSAPAGVQLTEPGTFTFSNLPPGDYRLMVSMAGLAYTDFAGNGPNPVNSRPDPVHELTTFTLKEGEARDLGALEYKPKVELLDGKVDESWLLPDDKLQVFQP